MPASYRLGIEAVVEAIRSRPMRSADRLAVAELIATSTNAWYQARGAGPIFPDGPASTTVFFDVYETLDPGCGAGGRGRRERTVGRVVFLPSAADARFARDHERHPSDFGRGVARALLAEIVDFADRESKPLRLVSSAMNLDSFSLYNRAGLVPRAVYQDMIVSVPEGGLRRWRELLGGVAGP